MADKITPLDDHLNEVATVASLGPVELETEIGTVLFLDSHLVMIIFTRVGKKAAGRKLYGVTHDGRPPA